MTSGQWRASQAICQRARTSRGRCVGTIRRSAHGRENSLAAVAASALLLLAGRGVAPRTVTPGSVRDAGRGLRPDQDAVDSVVETLRRRRVQARRGRRHDPAQRLRHDRGERRAQGRRLHDRRHDRGLQDRRPAHGGPPARRRQREALAADIAENGLQGRPKFDGKSVVPTPGDTVIQRANLHGRGRPSGGTTTARFLYVEAYNKSTKVTGTTTVTGPTLALSYAGADGVFSTADQHGPLHRHRPDARRVHVPPSADPPDGRRGEHPGRADDGPHRRAAPPAARRDTLQGHRVARQGPAAARRRAIKNQPFFTHYMDPTENRARPGRAGRRLPEPGVGRSTCREDLRLPAQVAGDHGRAPNAIGTAPAGQLGAPLLDTTGEITAARPVASIPFNGTAGQAILATVDAIPSG